MHRTLVAAILAFAPPALAAPADEVLPLADAFDQAQVDKNAEVLDRSLADDLVFIKGGGTVAGKAEFIATFTGESFQLEPFELKDRRLVELSPDVVSATAEVTLKGTEGGTPFSEHIRFSDIWARRGDTWQVVYIHVSLLPAP